jgi:hypothetical protein
MRKMGWYDQEDQGEGLRRLAAPSTHALIAGVNEILIEYPEHLPLTIRQVFYRLVGAYSEIR